MVLTTRFRYLLILVGFFGLLTFLRPHTYLPNAAQEYLPEQFRPTTFPVEEKTNLLQPHESTTSTTTTTAGLSKQSLWNHIHEAFEAHNPKHFDRLKWPGEWPTMPKYQMNKTFVTEEVLELSPTLSEADMAAAKKMQASLEASIPTWQQYSGLYSGKGYVMTTGAGFLNRVFPIGLQMLHRLDSKLPIEIWTKNQEEYDITIPVVTALARDFGMSITCHRFSDYVDIKQFPQDYTSNYLMKALTMLLTSFEVVIMLDADNVPMLSPEPLLASQEYKETGLMLWPDFWSNSLAATLHDIMDIPYTFHRSCESGQVILDKRRHFESLVLACYYNWYGDKYYHLITLDGMGSGDKDTFVVGAQSLGRPFHFTTRPVELLRAAHLDGRPWREDTSVFTGAMGQFNPLNMSQVMFMHMHSPKLNFQDQEDVTLDLVFVRSDYDDVHFHPSQLYLEKLLWQSVVWVECDSPLFVKNDPQKICQGAKARVAIMEQQLKQ